MDLEIKLLRCINCLATIIKMKSIKVQDMSPDEAQLLKLWVQKDDINGEIICYLCYKLIQNAYATNDTKRKFGQKLVCLPCGSGLMKRNFIKIEKEDSIASILLNSLPFEASGQSFKACNKCIKIARKKIRYLELTQKREITPEIEPDPKPDPTELNYITFHNLTCLPKSCSRCVAPKCPAKTLKGIPLHLRQNLMESDKVFSPDGVRICIKHMKDQSWIPIQKAKAHRRKLTAEEIEEAIALALRPKNVLDFENCQSMADDVCISWTGMRVINFLALHDSVVWQKALQKVSKTALAMALIKLRTKFTNGKLCDLFGYSLRNGNRMLQLVREDIAKADCVRDSMPDMKCQIEPHLMYDDGYITSDYDE